MIYNVLWEDVSDLNIINKIMKEIVIIIIVIIRINKIYINVYTKTAHPLYIVINKEN